MKKHFPLLALLLSLSLFACQTSETPTSSPPTESAAPVSATATESTESTLPTVAAADPALNATLQEVEGNVEAKDLVETDFSSAENGRTIQEEGQVRTLEDGYTRVDLSSGTLIRMAPSSYFTLIENQTEENSLLTRIKLEVGQIWIVLNGGSLEVETPSGQASVRGSYMMVEINPETKEAFISCLEGNCTLENPAGMLELINGQRAKLQPPELTEGDFMLPLIERMSEQDFAEWLFFAPEAENIFPILDKEGILPWPDWQEYIPEDDQSWFDLEELLPDEPLLDGDLLPDDGILLDGDGTLLDGDLLPGDGDLLPGDGDLLPGDGGLLPSDGGSLPELPGDGLPDGPRK